MRISEVKTNFRTAITLPEKSWARFRDILSDYCEKIKQPAGGSGPQGNTLGGPDQPHTLVSTTCLTDCFFLQLSLWLIDCRSTLWSTILNVSFIFQPFFSNFCQSVALIQD